MWMESIATATGASRPSVSPRRRHGRLLASRLAPSSLPAVRERTSALHPGAPFVESGGEIAEPPSLLVSGARGENAGGEIEPRIHRQPGSADSPASFASRRASV